MSRPAPRVGGVAPGDAVTEPAAPAGSAGPTGPKEPWSASRVLRLVGTGPIVGAVVSGVLVYLPTHDMGEVLSMSLLTALLLAGLRLVDPHLRPLWQLLDQIPRVARWAVGIGGTVWYSISQFGPGAAGREVSTLRRTLLVTILLGFVVLHPKAAPKPEAPTPKAPR